MGIELCGRAGLDIGHVQKITRFFQLGNGQLAESCLSAMWSAYNGPALSKFCRHAMGEEMTLMFLEDWAWNENVPSV